jgi:hypothetical protein
MLSIDMPKAGDSGLLTAWSSCLPLASFGGDYLLSITSALINSSFCLNKSTLVKTPLCLLLNSFLGETEDLPSVSPDTREVLHRG